MRRQDSDERSGVQKALQSTVEETSVAGVVKAAPYAVFRWPGRVNRSSIQGFQVGGTSHAFWVCFLDQG